jgi:uncharacterized protein YdaU (DUF1376 family)
MAGMDSFPFVVAKWQQDTAHLTNEQAGAYLRLLLVMWQNPDCRVPMDRTWLARKLKCQPSDVERTFLPIIEEFCQSDGHWITQKRIKAEWEKLRRKSDITRGAAKLRWNKTNPDAEAMQTYAEALQPHIKSRRSKAGYAFERPHVRLTQEHYDGWKKAYAFIELDAELQNLSDYLASERAKPAERKDWFMFGSNVLRLKNQKAKEARLASAEAARGLNGHAPSAPTPTREQRLAAVLAVVVTGRPSSRIDMGDVRSMLAAGKITPAQARMYGVTPEPSLPGI